MLFSEPKIPQYHRRPNTRSSTIWSFSALQRAENSSIFGTRGVAVRTRNWFQCSSASRKFLNKSVFLRTNKQSSRFQCSSASRKFLNVGHPAAISVTRATFQCSSASRKFLNPIDIPQHCTRLGVSVLFSEPKIPQ